VRASREFSSAATEPMPARSLDEEDESPFVGLLQVEAA
jgi:hypothetical protein